MSGIRLAVALDSSINPIITSITHKDSSTDKKKYARCLKITEKVLFNIASERGRRRERKRKTFATSATTDFPKVEMASPINSTNIKFK